MRLERHTRHFLIMTVCWTCSSLTYYLLTFGLANLGGGNLYFNGLASGLAELLSNLIVGTFLAEIGLKNTLIGSYLLLAIASIVYLFPILTLSAWYGAIIFCLKLGLVGSFAATFYGTNALFRTDLVALVFASANIVARGVTAVTPLITGDTAIMAVIFSAALLGMMAANFIHGDVLMKKRKKSKSNKKKRRSKR